jgi:hypothetical protein
MFAMEAFRDSQCAYVHHLVGHDLAIPADGAADRLHCAKMGLCINRTRFSLMGAPLHRDGHAGQHSLDALTLCGVSFSQPLSISRAGQAFATAASCA